MKRKTWRSKLTKTELSHLKWLDVSTLTSLKVVLEYRRRHRLLGVEPCYTCKDIAIKLDIET